MARCDGTMASFDASAFAAVSAECDGMMAEFDAGAGAGATASAVGTFDFNQSWKSEHHKVTDDAGSVMDNGRIVELERGARNVIL